MIRETTSLIFILLAICFFQSCVLEKRVHLSGYHIDFAKHKLSDEQHSISPEVSPKKNVFQNAELVRLESKKNQQDTYQVEPIKNELKRDISKSFCKKATVNLFNNRLNNVSPYNDEILIKTEIQNENIQKDEQTTKPHLHAMALVSLVFGIAGFFIFGYVFGIIGVIAGITAIVSIHKKKKHKGTGVAIAGILVSLIEMIVLTYLIATGVIDLP